jgi:hypothetical protein
MKKTESPKETEETSKTVKLSEEFTIPLSALMEHIIRALGVLADKGGKARFKDISGMFGAKRSNKALLSASLSGAVAFGLTEPHKGKAPYVISPFGKKFLTVSEEQKRMMMLPKFLGFEGYRNILVQMKNKADKTLTRDVITNAWLTVVGSGKLSTRKLYTRTFVSVGSWSGALEVTGRSCSLAPEAEEVLSQILKGGEVKPPPTMPPKVPPSTMPTGLSFQVAHCPHCGKAEFSIENEELLNTVSADGTNVLIIKYTFYCRGCRGTFSRIGQQTIKTD